ncbi:MAG: hypothetical protein Q9207_003016 [Kuettlingeria erythrocarpa]
MHSLARLARIQQILQSDEDKAANHIGVALESTVRTEPVLKCLFQGPNEDPTKPPLAFIEVRFDVDALLSGSDVSNVLSNPPAQATQAPLAERPFAFLVQNPETDEAEGQEEDLELEEEVEDGRASRLPLVQLSENVEEPGLTSIRLNFMRPKALKDTLQLKTWQKILTYTLDGFVRSVANHSGMVAEGDGYRITSVTHNDTALSTRQKLSDPNKMKFDQGSVQAVAGVEDPATSVGKTKAGMGDERAMDWRPGRQRDPEERKGYARVKLIRDYRELAWEEEWLEQDMAARRKRFDQIRESKVKISRELDRL